MRRAEWVIAKCVHAFQIPWYSVGVGDNGAIGNKTVSIPPFKRATGAF